MRFVLRVFNVDLQFQLRKELEAELRLREEKLKNEPGDEVDGESEKKEDNDDEDFGEKELEEDSEDEEKADEKE